MDEEASAQGRREVLSKVRCYPDQREDRLSITQKNDDSNTEGGMAGLVKQAR